VRRIVRVRREAGEVDSLDAVSAELMLARVLVDSIEAAGHFREASISAAVTAGFPAGTLLDPEIDPDTGEILSGAAEEFIERAVAADPTIRLARTRLRLAEADAAASAIERKPSLNLGLDLSGIDGDWGYLGGSVGLELPIGRWGEDPATAAFRYRAEVIHREIEIRELQIRRELAPLLEEIKTTAFLVREFDQRVHPLLLERLRIAIRLYTVGSTDYLAVLAAHEEKIEEEFDHLALRLQLARLVDEVKIWIGE
jgi:outer membrane protein TolC